MRKTDVLPRRKKILKRVKHYFERMGFNSSIVFLEHGTAAVSGDDPKQERASLLFHRRIGGYYALQQAVLSGRTTEEEGITASEVFRVVNELNRKTGVTRVVSELIEAEKRFAIHMEVAYQGPLEADRFAEMLAVFEKDMSIIEADEEYKKLHEKN